MKDNSQNIFSGMAIAFLILAKLKDFEKNGKIDFEKIYSEIENLSTNDYMFGYALDFINYFVSLVKEIENV